MKYTTGTLVRWHGCSDKLDRGIGIIIGHSLHDLHGNSVEIYWTDTTFREHFQEIMFGSSTSDEWIEVL